VPHLQRQGLSVLAGEGEGDDSEDRLVKGALGNLNSYTLETTFFKSDLIGPYAKKPDENYINAEKFLSQMIPLGLGN
jgi:hypothetical protein